MSESKWAMRKKRINAWLRSLKPKWEIVRDREGMDLSDQIETKYAKAYAPVNEFALSLFANAFRGALVPQHPADEPASILINRTKQKGQPYEPAH